MQLTVTGRNLDVSDWQRDYVEKKMNKFSRILEENAQVRVELGAENARSATQRQVVQVTCLNNGVLLRSEERAGDVTTALDAVVDKLERQVTRVKDKRITRKKRRAQLVESEVAVMEEPASSEPFIARVKRFRTLPMSEEEAIEQMENLGHTFFGFFNRETGELNVIYKRLDGNYGRIEYEVR